MIVINCVHCPWSQQVFESEADAKLDRHLEHRHPDVARSAASVPVPHEPLRAGTVTADWWTQSIDAIAALPAGTEFTLFEACGHLPEPINPRAQWGQLARDAHHLGLMEDIGFTESKRPGSASSAVKRWRRTATTPPTSGRRTA